MANQRQDPRPTSHAQAQAEATQNQQTQNAPEKPKRTRSAISAEKRLAMALLAIIAAFDAKNSAAIKETLDAGRALVKDVNEKFIKPTQDRIAALKIELEAAFKASAPDYANIGKLSSELSKLETKLKTATAPPPAN